MAALLDARRDISSAVLKAAGMVVLKAVDLVETTVGYSGVEKAEMKAEMRDD